MYANSYLLSCSQDLINYENWYWFLTSLATRMKRVSSTKAVWRVERFGSQHRFAAAQFNSSMRRTTAKYTTNKPTRNPVWLQRIRKRNGMTHAVVVCDACVRAIFLFRLCQSKGRVIICILSHSFFLIICAGVRSLHSRVVESIFSLFLFHIEGNPLFIDTSCQQAIYEYTCKLFGEP